MDHKELQQLATLKGKSGAEIYRQIIGETPPLRFCDVLADFIRSKSFLDAYAESRQSISKKMYSDIICQEFTSRQVPAHFEPAEGSLRKLSMNWLSAKTVSRENVILLGFGLGMSLNEVEYFLTQALFECAFNPKDPFETVAWYCFKNSLDFHRFTQLWSDFIQSERLRHPTFDLSSSMTNQLRCVRNRIDSEASLFDYLSGISVITNRHVQSLTARKYFMDRYREISGILYPTDKGKRDSMMLCPSLIEKTLYMTTPMHNKNLAPFRGTPLGSVFDCYRLTRQRIGRIVDRAAPIDRKDLITLSFLFHALSVSDRSAVDFVDHTDAMLIDCGMSTLNARFPYDKMLVLCSLTEDPVISFVEAFELCYPQENTDA